jgi:ABC-type multidrug transport system ATPase subunit
MLILKYTRWRCPVSHPIITVDRGTKGFRDGTRALDGLTLFIPTGGVYGLIGPNGAGKTTLIRILMTLLRPDSGTVRVAGLASPGQARCSGADAGR